MYVFINDLSISPDGVSIKDNWGLIKNIIHLTNELRKYNITRVRVPEKMISKQISGSHAIAHYLQLDKNTFDHEDKALLSAFLANNIEERPDEVAAIIEQKQENKLVDVYFNDVSSNQFLEASLIECPLLTFQTSPDFCLDILDAKFVVCNEEDKIKESDIKIKNIFKAESISTHEEFLIDWKRKIVFTKTKWKPLEKPIWNDLTKRKLEELGFPESISKKVDKKDELRRVGTIVAEMNAWIYDKEVTLNNKSGNHLRLIFRSEAGGSTCYLSLDHEKPSGRFEIYNRHGKHQGEIDFLGKYKEEADKTKGHDIIV
jgi:hypothetical protein